MWCIHLMGMAMMGVGANKNIKKLKKYVVYSSDGYGYDGCRRQ